MKYKLKKGAVKKLSIGIIGIIIITVAFVFLLPHNNKVDAELGNDFYNAIVSEREKIKRPVKITIDFPVTSNEVVDGIITEYLKEVKTSYNDMDNHKDIKQVDLDYEKYYFSEELVSVVFEKNTKYKDKEDEVERRAFTFDMVESKELALGDLFYNKVSFDSFASGLVAQLQASDVDQARIDEIMNVGNDFLIDDEGIWINVNKSKEESFIQVSNTVGMKPIYKPFVKGQEPETMAQINEIEAQNIKGQHEGQKLIALSFDDGPHNTFTPQLLDILAQKDVKASFFVLGKNVDAYPNIVYRAVAEGHEVGSHSYTHANLSTASSDVLASEIGMTQNAIYNATWQPTTMMRPPYGAYNDTVVSASNAAIIMWSVDTMDWKSRDTNAIVASATANAHDGAIILMHDIYGTTVDAVGPIIDKLREDGYTIVSVETLLQSRQGMQTGGVYFGGK